MKVNRVLISVSDKTGLEGLAKVLGKFKVEILSTGGTAKTIRSLGIPVIEVGDYTGFPEMLDGRVKTLHPKIHGGLLALRDNKEHMETAGKHGIGLIDMVVVNLYPFEKTVADKDAGLDKAIENIDIGGPSMLRSAAKNFRSVCVICDPEDYGRVIDEMENSSGCVSEALLSELGVKVFGRTSAYDRAIYLYLKRKAASSNEQETAFPARLDMDFVKLQDLRYGENPHQKAAFYKDLSGDVPGLAGAVQLHGKELSFNNLIDLDAALSLVKEFEVPAAAIIKHTNPCGAACGDTLRAAYINALDCDRLSAFGSIVGFNRSVDIELANVILEEADFVECIIAPSYDMAALTALKVKKNLRLLELKDPASWALGHDSDIKKVAGGLLIQDRDTMKLDERALKVVTKTKPTQDEMRSLLFGWAIAKHVKSNAIVLCKGTGTVGVGAGQMSRVYSVAIACRKAGDRAVGAVLASDAFFPKEDGVELAAKSGVKAIIQPGGSIRDEDVIKAADKLGIAMIFTGIRHFKH